jgi:hypothetical protein
MYFLLPIGILVAIVAIVGGTFKVMQQSDKGQKIKIEEEIAQIKARMQRDPQYAQSIKEELKRLHEMKPTQGATLYRYILLNATLRRR